MIPRPSPARRERARSSRSTPAIFIYGIGWPLADGYPHEMRAADYDDWVTETVSKDGKPMHGLNGDILVWNPVTRRRHELTSMGVRVTKETLKQQLEMSGQLDFLDPPLPPGDPQRRDPPVRSAAASGSRDTYMLLLRKAHLGDGQRHRVARCPQGDGSQEKHPRA